MQPKFQICKTITVLKTFQYKGVATNQTKPPPNKLATHLFTSE